MPVGDTLNGFRTGSRIYPVPKAVISSSIMKNTVLLVGAQDTKGPDIEFLKNRLHDLGLAVLVVDTSIMGGHSYPRDVIPKTIAEAGGGELASLQELDRGAALEVMRRGLVEVVTGFFREGRAAGMMGIGGGAGTSVITAAMRALPLGVPKVMLSTLASGETSQYIREKDIVMIPSIVDFAGINRISAGVYARAAGALAGMLINLGESVDGSGLKPVVGATMFGNTTDAVQRCKEVITAEGTFEVIVFHATGTGGRSMESIIREGGIIEGVVDMTLTELADELTGGVMAAGADRLTAAGAAGIPQVLVPGCVDMVNFWAPETVPGRYRNRKFHSWNPNVTLMRTNVEENRVIGGEIARKAGVAKGPVAVFLPLKGVSLLDSPGGDFWNPEADEALFSAIRENLPGHVELIELDYNINESIFAEAVAGKFLDQMKNYTARKE